MSFVSLISRSAVALTLVAVASSYGTGAYAWSEKHSFPIISVAPQATSAVAPVNSNGMGPLRVSASNPRYFTDSSGKAVYLTGSATHASFKDWGYRDPSPAFDYTAYLDFLQKHNHNFIRLWTFDQTQWVRFSDSLEEYATVLVAPFPWLRTGPGTAQDGKPKFDLNQFDEGYFDRLRQRIIDAGARGIYVSIMLFEGNVPQMASTALRGNPFSRENNINGVSVDQNGDGYALEAYDLSVPAITAKQEAYVRKVIDTVNDLDNVLYEVCNECPSGSTPWQYHMIDLVKNYESTKPKQHPVGMTTQFGNSTLVLYESKADWISPAGPDLPFDFLTDPRPADGRKVIILDSDHITYFDAYPGMIWKWFLRGMNPIFIDLASPLRDKLALPQQNAIRDAMGQTRTYAEKMNLAGMTPRGDLTSTGYALANPGVEYLVYQATSDTSFTLNLLAGTYSFEWFNPQTGSIASSGSFTISSGSSSFSPPFSGESVLYLKSSTAGASLHPAPIFERKKGRPGILTRSIS